MKELRELVYANEALLKADKEVELAKEALTSAMQRYVEARQGLLHKVEKNQIGDPPWILREKDVVVDWVSHLKDDFKVVKGTSID